MKINYLLIIATVAAFSSCNTAYRSGQTPDDVYYSPAPASAAPASTSTGSQDNSYLTTLNNNDQNSYAYRNDEEGSGSGGDINSYYSSPISFYNNPLTLGMSMGYGFSPYSMYPYNSFMNPYSFNGLGYSPYGLKGLYNPYSPYYDMSIYSPYNFYSPYSFGYSPFGFGLSPLGYGISSYYGSFYSPILYSSTTANTNIGPRKYNLNVYNTDRMSTNVTDQPIRSTQTGTIQPSGGTGVGNVLRRVFSPQQNRSYITPNNTNNRIYNNRSSNENNSYNQTPQRSFNNNSSSVSSPSFSGGNNAPVRSFRR